MKKREFLEIELSYFNLSYFINHSLASSMLDKAFAFKPVNLFTILRNIFFTPVMPTTAVYFKRSFVFLPDSLTAETTSLFE